MADKFFDLGDGTKIRYKDMGDGTFAEVISVAGGGGAVGIISGIYKVDQTLTFTQSPGYTVTAGNWTRDGANISGATNFTYKQVAADLGKAISFKIGTWTYSAIGGTTAADVPGAPTIGTATAGNGTVSVAFSAPASDGGSAITGYKVTLNNGDIATGASSPITVTGQANGVAKTAVAQALNSIGYGPASAVSNSVTPVPSVMMIVGNRGTIPQTQRVNSGAVTDFQQWITHEVVEACTSLSVRCGNFDSNTNNGPSALTLRMGLKASNTTTGVNGVWASSGTIDGVISPGAIDECIFNGNFTTGQILYFVVRGRFATAPANWPCYVLDATTINQVNEIGTALADKTTLNSIPGSRAIPDALFRPISICGLVSSPTKPYRILLLGDSITSGSQNDSGNVINGLSYGGWAQRSLADNWPWSNNGYAGLTIASVVGENAAHQAIRNAAINGSGFTHIFITLCTNDLVAAANSGAVTAVLNNVAALNTRYEAMGLKVIWCTAPPRTDSANTAPTGYGTGTGRETFNAAVIATYPTRCLNIASVMQDATNAQLWRADLGTPTADGIHPNPVIHNQATAYASANLPALLAA